MLIKIAPTKKPKAKLLMGPLMEIIAEFDKRETLAMQLKQRVKEAKLKNSYRSFRYLSQIPKKKDHFRLSKWAHLMLIFSTRPKILE